MQEQFEVSFNISPFMPHMARTAANQERKGCERYVALYVECHGGHGR